jgi:hypothetical protein
MKRIGYLKLMMTPWERFVWRLFFYVFYGLIITLAVIWVFSELLWMRMTGIALTIFLVYKSLQFKKESVSAWAIVEYALDRAVLFGGNFYLWVVERCLTYDDVKQKLQSEGVVLKSYKNKIGEDLKKTLGVKKNRKELAVMANGLLAEAIYVSPADLFVRAKMKLDENN